MLFDHKYATVHASLPNLVDQNPNQNDNIELAAKGRTCNQA